MTSKHLQPKICIQKGKLEKKVSKERQRWTKEDTAVVETVFEEELLHTVASEKLQKVTNMRMKKKISRPELENIPRTYGEHSLYEKLWTLSKAKWASKATQ